MLERKKTEESSMLTNNSSTQVNPQRKPSAKRKDDKPS